MLHPSIHPRRFLKRPIEVEAMVFDGTGSSQVAIKNWAGDAVHVTFDQHEGFGISIEHHHLTLPSIHSSIQIDIGDWIVKSANGEFYRCRPDVFEKQYEPLDPMPGVSMVVDD